MPLTPSYGLPYPGGNDTSDVPRDIKALAEAVARELGTAGNKSINAGAGLTGGGSVGTDRTINVGAGTGITVLADSVLVDTTWADARYVNADGDTMSQPLNLPAPPPTLPTHACHKSYVDSRIWQGTQAQYDAIQTKDPTVLYCSTL